MRGRLVWGMLLAVLLVAGCARSKGMEFIRLRYEERGGVAGFDRAVQIEGDGRYQVTEKGLPTRSGHLTDQELRRLRAALQAVEWLNLRSAYTDTRVVDSISHSLSLETGPQVHHVTVGTGGRPPEPLSALLDHLAQIMMAKD